MSQYRPRSCTSRHSLCSCRDGFGHPQRSQNGVIDAVLRHGVVWYVAGLLGVLAAAVAELGELFVGSLVVCLVCP